MGEGPDVLIAVYSLLDSIRHFHRGEACILEWYRKADDRIGGLLFDTGFLDDKRNGLIVISDHGFCSFGEAKVRTLPTKSAWGKLKGDHHEDALLITVNIDHPTKKPQDVFLTIREAFAE